MNIYQKQMFHAYWFPVALFYVFPSAAMILFAWPVKAWEVFQYFLPFPIALFSVGYILAPIIGPKVVSAKVWSFFMAFICLSIASLVFIAFMAVPSFEYFSFGLSIVAFIVMLGIFPALLGGLLFIGGCERIEITT